MSEVLEALVLGIIQGLTEFIPISSSGHLELAKFIFGDETIGKKSLFFIVVLHLSTAFATVWVYRTEIWDLLRDSFHKKKTSLSYFGKIAISMIPAVVIGVTLESEIASIFNQRIGLIGILLGVTGILLLLADRNWSNQYAVSLPKSVVIGIAQAIAILPGLSRSGSTIATSLLLGVERERAARFSFLMVVPLIFGKVSMDAIQGDFALGQTEWVELIVGFVAALITGIFACKWMIQLVRKSKLKFFAYYCFIAGFGIWIYLLT